MTVEELLAKVNVSSENYAEALRISARGRTIVMKRKVKERFVNCYNPTFLSAWKANIDVQVCLDQYAVISYITDYFAKDDSGLTQVLKEALKETENCNDLERLHFLKRIYFTHRQVSASEAVYRLLPGLNLTVSNIKAVFISTGFPHNRSTFMKKLDNEANFPLDHSDDECDGENDTHEPEVVSVVGREGKYKKVMSIDEKYSMRPKSIDQICLAQFSTSYVSCV